MIENEIEVVLKCVFIVFPSLKEGEELDDKIH